MTDEPIKRLLDFFAAAAGLAVLSPVAAAVGVAVGLRHGRPVLHRSVRVGRGERCFELYKFRTMTNARDAEGNLLPDADRLTPLGAWLRSFSLDELPQLWNVFKGDMSLVGPRPLPVEYLPRYTPEERRRHGVRPGITGWAQVQGRNLLSWDERLAMDAWYAQNRTILLDLRILARTVPAVVRRHGVNAGGHVTMPNLRPELADAGR